MVLAFIHKLCDKIHREYLKAVFLDSIHSKKKGLRIVGDYTLINKHVMIGNNLLIYPGVMFYGQGDIVVGDNVSIGNNTILYASEGACGGVTIGNNVMIAANCYIIDCDHGMEPGIEMYEQPTVVERVVIGNDVWLGADVKILKGTVIEDGAVVGAGSVVKGLVKKNTIVAGSPAKFIRNR